MRAGLVVLGVVFVVLGAVLTFVALIPQSGSFTTTTPGHGSSANYTIFAASPSLFGGTQAKFSWSSSVPVTLYLITCTKVVTTSELNSATSSSQISSDCGTNATYGSTTSGGYSYSTGSSGSFSFSIPASGSVIYYAASSSPGTVSATLTTSEPLGGQIVLILGIVLLLVGVASKSHKPKAPKGAAGGTPGAPGQPMNAWSPSGPGAPPRAGYQQPPPRP